MIALNKPLAPDLKKLTEYLAQVNESGWYTNFGPLHQLLTERLEKYLGVKNLLLVSNGTLAIQVACRTLDIESAITTPFSFVATTSSLLWQGVDTAFCDISPNSFNMCVTELDMALSRDNKYHGIVATHVYGNPCNVEGIESIAKKYNKKIIYDASHAFGVDVGTKSVLNFGHASTLSFHATKVFHTIEGGAIIFKNKSDFDKAKQLINFGIKGDGTLGKPGINAKLSEYQCAVGLTLLDEIDDIISHRAALFNTYIKNLKDIVTLPKWHEKATLNGSYMPIFISSLKKQECVLQALKTNNIQYRRYFTPSLDLAFPELKSFGCLNSQEVSEGIFCLPLHYHLTHENVLTVCNVINKAMSK
ncbi:DegT/DnrJ/EryC1/StrS family aminotransferase [Alteromonas sp. RW2A1]|uniref:DegT/DnrJ/EryC1/StrS family aminotransferase n=1 Tax=Alteromonas sp. RW2A1 TaxID=1917158 RepID=UPI0009FB8CD2|nr:DegT/DnrJ/EryC1/StrS family aminotransferase [Alteromonas sp. RW2A1]